MERPLGEHQFGTKRVETNTDADRSAGIKSSSSGQVSFESHKATVSSEKVQLQDFKASPYETFAQVDEEDSGSVKGLIGKLVLAGLGILLCWCCLKQ